MEEKNWGGHDPHMGQSAIEDRMTGKQQIVMPFMVHQKKALNMS